MSLVKLVNSLVHCLCGGFNVSFNVIYLFLLIWCLKKLIALKMNKSHTNKNSLFLDNVCNVFEHFVDFNDTLLQISDCIIAITNDSIFVCTIFFDFLVLLPFRVKKALLFVLWNIRTVVGIMWNGWNFFFFVLIVLIDGCILLNSLLDNFFGNCNFHFFR